LFSMEVEVPRRIEKVFDVAKRLAVRFKKEIGLDEEEDYDIELDLGISAQRVVWTAVKEGLDLNDEALAYLALGETVTGLHYFVRLRVPFKIPDAVITIMKRLDYEEVKDCFELRLIDMLSKAELEHVDGVLAPHNTVYLVFATPSGTVAFKRALEVPKLGDK